MHNIPNPDLYDAQRWAEQAAADEDAELTYRRMREEEEYAAAEAAALADVEAAYLAMDEVEAMDTDLF